MSTPPPPAIVNGERLSRLTIGRNSFGLFITIFLVLVPSFATCRGAYPIQSVPDSIDWLRSSKADCGPKFQRGADWRKRAYLIIVGPNGCDQRLRNVVHPECYANESWLLRSVRLADRRKRLPDVTFWRVRLCAAAEETEAFPTLLSRPWRRECPDHRTHRRLPPLDQARVRASCFASRIAARMLEGLALPWPAMS